ncbi:MAG: hypothetical protein ONB16_01320 [candidate division KSB1 bacterium]|nr:hypothetical protein [candidate division KSB1 bacterium]MDZ7340438.1 hypothetical protein [candidate division KSB1 bacterium]
MQFRAVRTDYPMASEVAPYEQGDGNWVRGRALCHLAGEVV